jgi:uncharacterized delta-60 repeat protein
MRPRDQCPYLHGDQHSNTMRPVLLLPTLLLLHTVAAQPGVPDSAFNGNGIVVTDISSGSNDLAQDVTFQSDGKAVIAGFTGLTNQDFCLIRLLPDGSLDNSFGGDGKVTTEVNGASDRARAVTVQPDGKIIAAGHTHVGATDDIAVVRYNPDGALDNGFGINGRVIVDVDGDDRALSVVLQGDGKILAAVIRRAMNTNASPCCACWPMERPTRTSAPQASHRPPSFPRMTPPVGMPLCSPMARS